MSDPQLTTAMPGLAGVTHRWLDVRGLLMHVVEAGSGEPVLLLHGFPQNWWEWHGVIPRLAEQYHVIAVDQRGAGWTDAPRVGYDARTLVEDIVLLIEELDLGRVRIIAHDWGAIVAQLLALDRPDLVEALVVLSCPDLHVRPDASILRLVPKIWFDVPLATAGVGVWAMAWGKQRIVRMLLKHFEPPRGLSGADIDLYLARLRDPGRARAGSALYRDFILPAFMRLVAGRYADEPFAVPVLVMIGENDPSAALQRMGYRSGLPARTFVEVLPGEGHFIVDHRPEVVAQRAADFFRTEKNGA